MEMPRLFVFVLCVTLAYGKGWAQAITNKNEKPVNLCRNMQVTRDIGYPVTSAISANTSRCGSLILSQ
jgi:hypothetical protein